MQSRYYNPEIGRFINADGLVSTGQGLLGNNMFAYCLSNPVNIIDPTGTCGYIYSIYFWSDCGKVDCPKSKVYNAVDITDKLNEAMRDNAEALEEYRSANSYLKSVSYFVDKVKPGGDWDFKSQTEEWNLDANTTYLYEDNILRYDDVGNIHYGYVGRILFSANTLLTAGGMVQIYAGTSSWEY